MRYKLRGRKQEVGQRFRWCTVNVYCYYIIDCLGVSEFYANNI